MELAGSFKENPVNLFREWMQNGQNLKTVAQLNRTATKETEAENKYAWVKLKKLDYTEDMKKDLLERKRRAGFVKPDPEFPDAEGAHRRRNMPRGQLARKPNPPHGVGWVCFASVLAHAVPSEVKCTSKCG